MFKLRIKQVSYDIPGQIPINQNISLDVLIYADDLILSATSEDDLQRPIYNL